MSRSFRGCVSGIEEPVLGTVLRDDQHGHAGAAWLVQVASLSSNPPASDQMLISSIGYNRTTSPGDTMMATVSSVPAGGFPDVGDILLIEPSGQITALFYGHSDHNFLFVTGRCNSNCLMCSQPPTSDADIPFLWAVNTALVALLPRDLSRLGITGGEPTLLGQRLFELLGLLRTTLPATHLQLLTNGRAFASRVFAERLAELGLPSLTLGVPLYSDYPPLHDHVVQANGAFRQTVTGLYNLATYDQMIQLRIVLVRPIMPRLGMLADFICRYLPFVAHVAFMGMEEAGNASLRRPILAVDPFELADCLSEAITLLTAHGLRASVFNIPLCMLPENLRPYCETSISEWKRVYPSACGGCELRRSCGGTFESNLASIGKEVRPQHA